MAPRSPETLDQFITRLRSAVSNGAAEVRFGQHHFSHVVCVEEGDFVVRRLVCSKEAADAYMAEHSIFMPEHAEQLAEPADEVMREPTIKELDSALQDRWPL